MDPAELVHYLAALTVARLSPADIGSTFRSAVEMRALTAEIAKRSIPDAARYLRARFGR